ncbi:NEL-type E3 ubiquitin ligase domain-containing protein [Pseudomonas sp. CC120222-01a]|uniref:NEL-type E3 ubiquitin ligase domain-containing protein n=1 Tax=Pseudomonas sp. CC120222-01a TaxID=1378075 RepID=UPI000D95A6EF|nr:NEL-type E3 ubiquitin ligase domain-containing protein [Pseudomonas sp. CC120222-01a]PVZ43663.1 E3 ligase-like protein (putative virulence factor) [Pseudomonas sp. CC120222-01a]
MGTSEHTHDRLEQAEQDRIIAARLPGWMLAASAGHAAVLREALNGSLDCRYRLAALLRRIEGVEQFTAPILQKALRERCNIAQELGQLWFRAAFERPLSTYAPIRVPLSEKVYYQIPLLEAALRNFTQDETQARGQAPGNGIFDNAGARLDLLSATRFAALVRELDLGERYQAHLQARLGTAEAQALLAENMRHTLLLDAFKARHDSVLSEAELELVIGLWRKGWLPQLNDSRVVGKRLEVLGCPLQQIVVLDVRDETFAPIYTSSQRVLVYIPGDPHGPWSAHDDLHRFARSILGQRLRNGDYRDFFARFVRRRDSQSFFSQVIAGYADLPVWANIDLQERMHSVGGYLFKDFAAMRTAQIKDDAALVATPVAKLDRELQAAHDQYLANLGVTLLSAASLYVPVLGLALLAMVAWRWLGEVFEAVESWREGETREALEHVTQVLIEVALVAATAAAGNAAQRVWTRSALVDGLSQARLEDGTQRLWNADLSAFRSELPVAATSDEQGVWRHGGQAWIAMDGHHYRAVQRATDGHWQLLPRDGHGPLLLHNGAGAWRLWSEQPMQWQGRGYLFRRLGGQMARLDDEQIAEVLAIHSLEEGHLRALHVLGQAPEPQLLDSVQRVLLDQRIRRLVKRLRSGLAPEDDRAALEQARNLEGSQGLSDQDLAELVWKQRRILFQRLYAAEGFHSDREVQALQRQFPSLHGYAARALLAQASSADRMRLLASDRVPLGLAEAARRMLVPVRMVRVFESLLWDTPQNLDLARVTLGMLKHLPGAGQGVRWSLFEGDAGARALATSEEGAHACGLVHRNGTFQRTDAQGDAVGEAGELFEVMTGAYTGDQRGALQIGEPFAHNLRVMVTRLAQARREEVEQLLNPVRAGGLRLPWRLDDGRIGYPLSGRTPGSSSSSYRPGPFLRRVRYLYPAFTDEEVFAWIEQARASAIGLERTLQQFEREFEALNRQLRRWVHEAASRREREDRRRLRRALRGCWQRAYDEGMQAEGTNTVYRWEIASSRSLPEFPEPIVFDHVRVLTLRNMQIERLPESFLRAFPNVRAVEMPYNRLERVPQALLGMPDLQSLDLRANRVSLDPGQATILASCPYLTQVNLSHNPLGRAFSLTGLPRLRELYLAGTGLRELPYGLMESPLLMTVDLRDNLLTSMPEGFYQSRLWIEGNVQLSGNPLSESESLRLRHALQAVAEVPEDEEAAPVSARLRWMDAGGAQLRTELDRYWRALEALPNALEFFTLIERLMETADFQHATGARFLASRVLEMMRAMTQSAELCQELFSNAAQLTCQDSVALRFSDLELRLLVWRAQAQATTGGDERVLLRLGRRLWRLEELDRIALRDIQERQFGGSDPDQIEVVLAYRVALREALDLPLQTQGMSFRPVAGVDARRIARARNLVLRHETGEQLAAALIERAFWQSHLRNAYPARFDALNAPFHERLEIMQADSTTPEAQRVAQINTLASEQRLAERDLMHTLTLEALDANSEQEVIYVR